MSGVRITNLPEFHRQTAAWTNAVRSGLERAVVRIMKDAQMFATLNSPVYSGDFASSWNVSWGKPDTTFNASTDYLGPEYPEPKSGPWGMGKFASGTPKLGQTAYLTNAAFHDEPYAWLIEDNLIKFRPVNSGKGRVAGKTFAHLGAAYKTITRGMLT